MRIKVKMPPAQLGELRWHYLDDDAPAPKRQIVLCAADVIEVFKRVIDGGGSSFDKVAYRQIMRWHAAKEDPKQECVDGE